MFERIVNRGAPTRELEDRLGETQLARDPAKLRSDPGAGSLRELVGAFRDWKSKSDGGRETRSIEGDGDEE